MVDSEKQLYVAVEIYTDILAKITDILTTFHHDSPLRTGLPKEELRGRIAQGLGSKLFQLCLAELEKKGIVSQEDGVVRLFSHQVSLQADEKRIREKMESLFIKVV